MKTISQRLVDSEAKRYCQRTAESLRDSYLDGFDRSAVDAIVRSSPFASIIDEYPSDDPLIPLGFTLEVAKTAVAGVCDDGQSPAHVAFVSARVCEYCVNSIIDPRRVDKPHRFLAASKNLGYFFTPPEVAIEMARAVLGRRRNVPRVLDPSSGIGSLLSAMIICAADRGIELESVAGIELDSVTAELSRLVLNRVTQLTGTSVRVEVSNEDAVLALCPGFFGSKVQSPADVIVMNPPYGRIKFLRSSLTNEETSIRANGQVLEKIGSKKRAEAEEQAKLFREISQELGLGGGAQDKQRLFIALALRTLADDGRLAVISPSSWLGDKDGLSLRRQLIADRLIRSIDIYPENAALFATVNQPTAVVVVDKSRRHRDFAIHAHLQGHARESARYRVSYAYLEDSDPDRLRIPRVGSASHEIIEKLQQQPRIRDCKLIKNARGELDLTLNRQLIESKPGPLRLVRGDHIERFVLRPAEYSKRAGFVDRAEFEAKFSDAPKYVDTQKTRVVGRQCSYMKKGRRLSFAVAPSGVVLGNSCNYLCSTDARTKDDSLLYAVAGFLNSIVCEWYFRAFSSNNHVANYEIDELPFRADSDELTAAVAAHSQFLHHAFSHSNERARTSSAIEDVLDALVALSLELSPIELRHISDSIAPARSDRLCGILEWFYEHGVPQQCYVGEGAQQHVRPSLSDLDMQIIEHVSQGGNWQDVPESVPSQRLAQIRAMTAERGVVRTTYYGRLDPAKPAYTIATYFNRPGNGTNIHPWEDRTLSSREAARLQSFPDWYCFLGTDGSVRKQIGNAVPPLLAYALGRHLSQYTDAATCLDLFAGAGGLSLGLEQAGWDVVAAVDNDAHALKTYAFNRPCANGHAERSDVTLVRNLDLSDPVSRKAIADAVRERLDGQELGAVVGGPPCQGFSHAGWRRQEDHRNDLASAFLEIVESLRPRLVMLENVEGLLTMNSGQVVKDLLVTLDEMGYRTETSPWKLCAEQFGVPQMRRRVFLVGSRSPTPLSQPEPVLARCKGRRQTNSESLFDELPPAIPVSDVLGDLPRLAAERYTNSNPVSSVYREWLLGQIDECSLFAELASTSG